MSSTFPACAASVCFAVSDSAVQSRSAMHRCLAIATRLWFVLLVVMGAAFVSGFLVYPVVQRSSAAPEMKAPGVLWPEGKQLDAFTLTDQRYQPFTLARLKGKWTFLFFGYTSCPDVCPATLALLKAVRGELVAAGDDVDGVQMAMVSVDPARDSRQRLGDYVEHFDETFLGLGGSDPQVNYLARQVGAVYFRGEPDENGFYAVDHSTSIMLIDPIGRLVAALPAPHESGRIAAQLRAMRAGAG